MIRTSALIALVTLALGGCSEDDAQLALDGSARGTAGNELDAATSSSPTTHDASSARASNTARDADSAPAGNVAPDAGANQLAFANCTPLADQTCNDNPMHSSLHGHCEADRQCTCRAEFGKNPATGRCF